MPLKAMPSVCNCKFKLPKGSHTAQTTTDEGAPFLLPQRGSRTKFDPPRAIALGGILRRLSKWGCVLIGTGLLERRCTLEGGFSLTETSVRRRVVRLTASWLVRE